MSGRTADQASQPNGDAGSALQMSRAPGWNLCLGATNRNVDYWDSHTSCCESHNPSPSLDDFSSNSHETISKQPSQEVP